MGAPWATRWLHVPTILQAAPADPRCLHCRQAPACVLILSNVAETRWPALLALTRSVSGGFEQVVFTDHSLFGFADVASILMNKVGNGYGSA